MTSLVFKITDKSPQITRSRPQSQIRPSNKWINYNNNNIHIKFTLTIYNNKMKISHRCRTINIDNLFKTSRTCEVQAETPTTTTTIDKTRSWFRGCSTDAKCPLLLNRLITIELDLITSSLGLKIVLNFRWPKIIIVIQETMAPLFQLTH